MELGLYDWFRRKVRSLSDTFYFGIGKRLRKSTAISWWNVSTLTAVFLMLFLLSGGVLAITSPPVVLGVLFSRTLNSQTPGETVVVFLIIFLAFLGLYLVERGMRRRPEMTSFTVGLSLYLITLAILWILVYQYKTF